MFSATAVRKAAVLGLGLLWASAALASDWKAAVLPYLGQGGNYREAWRILGGELGNPDIEDRQTALAFYAFLSRKTGQSEEERQWLARYFDAYKDNDPDFSFLPEPARMDFTAFWGYWKSTAPVVTEVVFLEKREPGDLVPPFQVEMGVTTLNKALYRLSFEGQIIQGGDWAEGFHILTVPASAYSERSTRHEFLLDLKAGDIILRKTIVIESEIQRRARPAAASPQEQGLAGRPNVPADVEGDISLYIDDKLVMSSKKTRSRPRKLTIPISGPLAPNQKPYMLPPKNDPMMSSVSILDALGLAYQVLKDLTSKKPPPKSPPSYRKVREIPIAYTNPDSLVPEIQGSIRFQEGKTSFLAPEPKTARDAERDDNPGRSPNAPL